MYTHIPKVFFLHVPLKTKTKCLTLADEILFDLAPSINFCRSPAHTSPFLSLSVPALLIFLAFLRCECDFSCPRVFAHADSPTQKGLLFHSASRLHTNVFFKEAVDLPQTRSDCCCVWSSHYALFLFNTSEFKWSIFASLINVYLAHHDS